MADERNQLHIAVKGKMATLTEQNFQLVGGNSDYEVVFDFDEDWNNYPVKTALFVFGKETRKKVFDGNICEGVAIEGATMCLIGVFADDIATTTPACVSGIRQSIRDVAKDLPEAPEEDVYNQIMELLNRYIEQGGGGGGGENGKDGFSPTVSITPIENGHRVTITDINGDHSFDVMNGEKGEQGERGEQGLQGVQGEKGEQGEKGDPYVLTEADKTEIANSVRAELEDVIGDIDTVLEAIMAKQTEVIGGDT